MAQDIELVVIKAIAQQKHIDPSGINMGSTLDALSISSLDAITIVYEIEEIFDIEVPNEILESLETVQDIVERIGELIASRS